MKTPGVGPWLLQYWPVIAGSFTFVCALVSRSDLPKLTYRAVFDRVNLVAESHDLRKRFTVEVERADYWEQRCDDLQRQFQNGLHELERIKRALRAYKQIIKNLLVDREAALEWGRRMRVELVGLGASPPEPPLMITADINIIDPTGETTDGGPDL